MSETVNRRDAATPGWTVINAEQLEAEFAAGQEAFLEVPLSQAHLACLALAAQHALHRPDCGPFVRDRLQEFQLWCARHAAFGPETCKLLAQQAAAGRMEVQTHGREGAR